MPLVQEEWETHGSKVEPTLSLDPSSAKHSLDYLNIYFPADVYERK